VTWSIVPVNGQGNIIVQVDGSTGVRTDAEGFHAHREADRDGVLDPSLRHVGAAGVQGAQTALLDAPPVPMLRWTAAFD
jgi:hypothetical protein